MKFASMLVTLAVAALAVVAQAADADAQAASRHILAAGDDSILLARRVFRSADGADN